jgi:acyl-CoA thioesterase YciA
VIVNTRTLEEKPRGKLSLQVVALPRDTNAYGDIYAGWLVGQMDLAAAMLAGQISRGRSTTVAIERIEFLNPIVVGEHISCYTELLDTGRSSMKIRVEAFTTDPHTSRQTKITEAVFIYVALNEMGGIRTLPAPG